MADDIQLPEAIKGDVTIAGKKIPKVALLLGAVAVVVLFVVMSKKGATSSSDSGPGGGGSSDGSGPGGGGGGGKLDESEGADNVFSGDSSFSELPSFTPTPLYTPSFSPQAQPEPFLNLFQAPQAFESSFTPLEALPKASLQTVGTPMATALAPKNNAGIDLAASHTGRSPADILAEIRGTATPASGKGAPTGISTPQSPNPTAPAKSVLDGVGIAGNTRAPNTISNLLDLARQQVTPAIKPTIAPTQPKPPAPKPVSVSPTFKPASTLTAKSTPTKVISGSSRKVSAI